jgi:hypothetical protein
MVEIPPVVRGALQALLDVAEALAGKGQDRYTVLAEHLGGLDPDKVRAWAAGGLITVDEMAGLIAHYNATAEGIAGGSVDSPVEVAAFTISFPVSVKMRLKSKKAFSTWAAILYPFHLTQALAQTGAGEAPGKPSRSQPKPREGGGRVWEDQGRCGLSEKTREALTKGLM